MTWTPLDRTRTSATRTALQGILANLLSLVLLGKQAHWTVIGREFAATHAMLDELVADWRAWTDRLAERMVALEAVPDGQADAIAESDIAKLPPDWQDTHTAISAVADAVRVTIQTTRAALPLVAEEDRVTEGVLLDTLDGLEKQHWMLRAHLA